MLYLAAGAARDIGAGGTDASGDGRVAGDRDDIADSMRFQPGRNFGVLTVGLLAVAHAVGTPGEDLEEIAEEKAAAVPWSQQPGPGDIKETPGRRSHTGRACLGWSLRSQPPFGAAAAPQRPLADGHPATGHALPGLPRTVVYRPAPSERPRPSPTAAPIPKRSTLLSGN